MNELHDRIAVVTGAAGGIGAATVRAFVREGAAGIVLMDMNEDGARNVAKAAQGETSCGFEIVRVDVGDPDNIMHAFQRVKEKFPRLDILVNCAGICTTSSLEDLKVPQWDRVMAINLRGTFLCSREAMGLMTRGGRIVNITSISGQIGGIATGMDYAASKAGIIALTMSLAKAGGPKGIIVNAVAPGFIRTEMTRSMSHFDPQSVPLKRIGEPEDVADVIVFLASEGARYITGEIINVNGGWYMS
jgi:3-oxoacyl-[acyl-carrier protein] reductase